MNNNLPSAEQRSYEIIDTFTWEKSNKIITQDIHHIPALGNVTHFSRNASQPPIPQHFHNDFMEIFFIVKGRRDTRIYLNSGEIETCFCTGNEALIIFPNEEHSGGPMAQDPCESFALQLNIGMAENFLGLTSEYGRYLVDRLTSLKTRRRYVEPSSMRLLKSAFDLLAKEQWESGAAHIVCFLHEFIRMPAAEDKKLQPGNERILRVLDYIEKNVAEPITLNDLARVSEYSLSQFKSKFLKETGRTPAAYINDVKIREAQARLINTENSVTDIALELGWTTSNYFCSVFKKLTGYSPLSYRKKNRKDS